jgi:peptide/nickel transport system substrate-binding protein
MRRHALLHSMVAVVAVLAAFSCADDSSSSSSDLPADSPTSDQPGGEATAPEGTEAGSTPDDSTPTDTPAATAGGTLRVGLVGGGSESLDPHTWVASHDIARASLVFETLTELDGEGEAQMLLANSITPNDDATVWTVVLRDGVTFHDGKPMTTADVRYSIERIQTKGYGAAILAGIDLASSVIIDDLTIELHLVQANAEMPLLFADLFTSIVPDGVDDFTAPIGTGPFMLDSYTAGERSELVRYDGYWQDGKPLLDGVELIIISDPSARVNALLSDQIDVAVQIPATAVPQIESTDGLALVVSPGVAAVQYYMRMDTPPFDDPRVREAMKLAIDREKCVEVGLGGYGSVGNDLFGPSHPSYASDIPQREYDPAAAKALLAEAGYPDGISVELMTAKAGPGMQECAVVFADSAAAAGIDITVREVPPDEIYNLESNYLIVPFGPTQWSGSSFQEVARSTLLVGAYYNETAFVDEAFETAFRSAEAVLDEEARYAAFAELQQQQWQSGGYIVWGLQDSITAISTAVTGLEPLPINTFRLRGGQDIGLTT